MNSNGLSLVINYAGINAYALNVIVGALEYAPALGDVELVFASKPEAVISSIANSLNRHRTVLVAWSFYSPYFIENATKLRLIKAQVSDSRVFHIAGGVHATAEPEQTLRSGFDMVAVGEGEKTIVDLVSRLARGDDHLDVRGIAYLRDDHYVSNGLGNPIDLNEFPPFAQKQRKFNPIEITRGCIYACKFCQTPFMFKARFRHRTVDNICRYVGIMKDSGLTDVRFITPSSLSYGSSDSSVRLDRVEELLASVRAVLGDRGRIFFGSFPSEVRPEHVTPEALRILKKYVANNNLIIGAQSGSQRVLDSIHRGHTVRDIVAAVKASLDAGFITNVDFIFGLPDETGEDVQASLRLAEQLAEIGARIHGHTFMPLPGTPFRNARPGLVSQSAMKRLKRLESRGNLYGQWQQQISIAQILAQTASEPRRRHENQTIKID